MAAHSSVCFGHKEREITGPVTQTSPPRRPPAAVCHRDWRLTGRWDGEADLCLRGNSGSPVFSCPPPTTSSCCATHLSWPPADPPPSSASQPIKSGHHLKEMCCSQEPRCSTSDCLVIVKTSRQDEDTFKFVTTSCISVTLESLELQETSFDSPVATPLSILEILFWTLHHVLQAKLHLLVHIYASVTAVFLRPVTLSRTTCFSLWTHTLALQCTTPCSPDSPCSPGPACSPCLPPSAGSL